MATDLTDEQVRKHFAAHVQGSEYTAKARDGGDIAPMLVTVSPDGETEASVLADFPGGYEDKRDFLYRIGQLHGTQHRPVALVMFTSMAWVVRMPAGTPLEEVMKVSPSESPERVEVLVCSAATHDRRCMLWSRETTRNGNLDLPIDFVEEPTQIETMAPKGKEGVAIDLLDCYWLGYANS